MKVTTNHKRQVIDITDEVGRQLPDASGVATIFVQHTTAAVTTADLDPGTDEDFLEFLDKITPQANWRHPHNPAHAPDHLLASLIGPSVCVPYENGSLCLGTWQRIVLIELDGPRNREVSVISVSA
jgi:secondary thiamine-phosphate synthase enzyme